MASVAKGPAEAMVPPLKKTGTKEDRTMKTKIYLRVFAAVTMLAAFSCAKEIEPEVTVVGTTEETNQVRTYSVTVHAEKGEPATKALNLTGNTLQASWEEGEVVDVYKGDDKIGTLTAQSTGTSTTLKGTITTTLAEGDDLTLKFCSPSYATQDGTLKYIAANCDYATAEVTVSSIDNNTGIITACKGVNGGGIINNSGCTLQITGGLITNCRSDAGGGAIVNHGTATISGCTFRGNIATTRGGRIARSPATKPSPTAATATMPPP